ncbi:MAG: agmatinase family protein [Bacteroidetes bacterium]|nr:agmatinase family protein [Bacteroidota bacterium]MBU1580542.1 agmatinase family protein [Bacteroidota bacterium]
MSDLNFNPNAAATENAGIFGLPFDAAQSKIIIIPVEWELTTSYGKGTAKGPAAIKSASMQVDLHHHDYPELWEKGIWLDEFPASLRTLHNNLLPVSEQIIRAAETGDLETKAADFQPLYEQIETATVKKNEWLKARIAYWKEQGKIVGLLGGDHSIPLAFHQYLAEQQTEYGLLTVDAHLDLRSAYEGFKYSHASIFYNVIMHFNNVKKLVQVGIRDYCHEEADFANLKQERISVYYNREVRKQQFEGRTWAEQVQQMVSHLPPKVYISIDIDGLDPTLCPNTGTPVPGGLKYEETIYLLNMLKESGKEIIGFDLCEVAPGNDDWDGNVGARILFQLCGISG